MHAGRALNASALYGKLVMIMVSATPLNVGPPTSDMQKERVRGNCARMKSDYRYSANLVYNNFPWPEAATAEQRAKVEECAQGILDARQPHLDNGATRADLYAPLLKAYKNLDRAVDRCYRKEKLETERERVEFLFGLYEAMAGIDDWTGR